MGDQWDPGLYRHLCAVLVNEHGRHLYLSTACLHGNHRHCQNELTMSGKPKQPHICKFCDSLCVCPCHQEDADSGLLIVDAFSSHRHDEYNYPHRQPANESVNRLNAADAAVRHRGYARQLQYAFDQHVAASVQLRATERHEREAVQGRGREASRGGG